MAQAAGGSLLTLQRKRNWFLKEAYGHGCSRQESHKFRLKISMAREKGKGTDPISSRAWAHSHGHVLKQQANLYQGLSAIQKAHHFTSNCVIMVYLAIWRCVKV